MQLSFSSEACLFALSYNWVNNPMKQANKQTTEDKTKSDTEKLYRGDNYKNPF